VDALGNAAELRGEEVSNEPQQEKEKADYDEEGMAAQMKEWEEQLTEANATGDTTDILMKFSEMQWGCDRIRLRSDLGCILQGQRIVTTSCQECNKFTASRADPFICEEIRLRSNRGAGAETTGEHGLAESASSGAGPANTADPAAAAATSAAVAPVLELLQANAQPQRPESFICEGCNTLSSTDVEDKLLRLPEVFVVHINRADRYDRRIDTPVDFPEQIDLDTILLSTGCAYDGRMERCASTYTLQAICFHQGQSARVGHYFAALRDATDSERWWEVSDAWVSELTKHPSQVENIVGGPRSSMLFYVRDRQAAGVE